MIEGNGIQHARNRGVGGELDISSNIAFRGSSSFSALDNFLAADVHTVNEGAASRPWSRNCHNFSLSWPTSPPLPMRWQCIGQYWVVYGLNTLLCLSVISDCGLDASLKRYVSRHLSTASACASALILSLRPSRYSRTDRCANWNTSSSASRMTILQRISNNWMLDSVSHCPSESTDTVTTSRALRGHSSQSSHFITLSATTQLVHPESSICL